MGKNTTSWLTAVKRAFRSPIKDSHNKTSRRKVDHHHEDDEDKKTDRRRWLFGRNSRNEEKEAIAPKTPVRHAVVIRLTQPQNSAAKIIQTAFRGYLARKALIALRGIVKLQALIRGQNVRKQANMTMKCMQALLRVQARVRDQRARLSQDGRRRSMFAESSNIWDSKYLKDIRERRFSRWREDDCPRTLEELEAMLKARNEAALTQEKSLAFAFSQQTDADYRRDSIKTVDLDSLKTSINGRRSRCQSPAHRPRSPQVRTPSYSTANTPSLRSTQRWNSSVSVSRYSASNNDSGIPNYMAATESAKARIRSQSAPRQRALTPERVKKRLSYPVVDPYGGLGQNLRSPSFKSVQAGYVGMEEQSNYSWYAESGGGEISPCSTTDLRRWLR